MCRLNFATDVVYADFLRFPQISMFGSDISVTSISGQEMSRTFKGQEFYEWAEMAPTSSKTHRQYTDLEKSLEFIQELLRKHQPLDGLFGFSQGANMASLLAAQAVAGEGHQ